MTGQTEKLPEYVTKLKLTFKNTGETYARPRRAEVYIQNKAKQSKAKQSKAKQSKAETNKKLGFLWQGRRLQGATWGIN